MSKELKQQYFFMSMWYIGILFLLMSGIRSIQTGDFTTNFLLLIGILFLSSFWNYADQRFFPQTKGKRIIRTVFIVLLILLFIIGLFFI
ncbi:hypothetical protein EQV77_06490 [Halobacillus fulvus]|nr:hypothetical protein EQV77_06490 [Halobacillus fulvus]